MWGAPRPSSLLIFAFCLLPFLASCRQDMHDAPRYDPLERSAVWMKNSSAQPIQAGTVARGLLNEDTHLYEGKVDGQPATTFPFAIDKAALDYGQQRFNVYCAPCHGRTGIGNGMVVQRGFRQAQTLHLDRLREAPPGYFFDVITNGFGVMPDYKAQIPVEDRWKIIAYVRAPQLSTHGATADVPADELGKLDRPDTAGAAKDGKAEGGHKAGGQE